MNIIVISKIDAAERRTNMQWQLERTGLDYEFFNAIGGSENCAGVIESINEDDFLLATGRQITPGEIGCYASHRAIWHLCVTRARPAVVLEDDASLADDFDVAINLTARHIKRCGFVRLQNERRGRSRRVLQVDGDFSLNIYTKVPHGSAGYVIGPGVANALLASSAVMTAPIDIFLTRFWVHKQLMYGLKPYVVSESWASESSTIGPRNKASRSIDQRIKRQAVKGAGFFRRILEARRQQTALTHPSIRPVLGSMPPLGQVVSDESTSNRESTWYELNNMSPKK